jgi:hypothetical protein
MPRWIWVKKTGDDGGGRRSRRPLSRACGDAACWKRRRVTRWARPSAPVGIQWNGMAGWGYANERDRWFAPGVAWLAGTFGPSL